MYLAGCQVLGIAIFPVFQFPEVHNPAGYTYKWKVLQYYRK